MASNLAKEMVYGQFKLYGTQVENDGAGRKGPALTKVRSSPFCIYLDQPSSIGLRSFTPGAHPPPKCDLGKFFCEIRDENSVFPSLDIARDSKTSQLNLFLLL